jgi:putative endopeptidase
MRSMITSTTNRVQIELVLVQVMRVPAVLVLFGAACGSSSTVSAPASPPPSVKPQPEPAQPPTVEPHGKPITNTTLAAIGLDPAALDRKADPCEDFYQFACGGWQANAVIAPDLSETMRSFVDIELRTEAYLHDVLEKARTSPGDDAVMKQVGAYYAACMDEAGIERAGLKPIAPLLARIAMVKDARSLSAAVSTLQPIGLNALFSFGPTEDFADVTKMIGGLDQGGLTLPDRDYYLKDDDASKTLRTALVDYAAALLVVAGHTADAAKKEAGELLALETELAKVSKDKVALRDPRGIYNKIDRGGIVKAAPHFDWDGFFKTIGQPGLVDITVSAPDFLVGLDKLLVSTPPAVWRNYLTVMVLGGSADVLTKKVQDIAFKLEQKLSGAPEQRARWKRCITSTDRALPQSLGQIFVRDRFPGASKQAAEEQIRAIVDAMGHNIDTLPWMDATTKAKAKTKVTAIASLIGYPATWKTYAFKIDQKAFAANVMGAQRERLAREVAKIGKPVDRTEWDISPSMVNAFYHPVHNKIVFPAGILQTPFYQVDHSIPVNLGAIGMVVGHEVTHGFDDEGAQFDAVGNLANWWQPETEKQFKQRTKCVVDQYSAYPAGGAKLNGALTSGENIADIGGVKLALAAYRNLRASAAETTVADGFTEDQQFFLSFGQTWCSKQRPEYEAKLVAIDPHSPPRWRVNGTVSATPDFAKAFHCKLGATLRPKNACVVW